ncbi:Peptidase C48, SUMO/Sentrin/Ubl1 [Pseudomonas savastanoi pv. nerii]|uniref:Ulp1 family type III secretion system effector isopeptidase XopD n=1 Tax=Pseudomonas TaxID=286 RepID=UPI0005C98A8F|nr:MULTISPECIES: Ulp1 family type III secretion system effector isopeptidase XopD [Pseudomonas]KAA3533813.1 peptidase [Pseudomonas savastanoi]KPY00201.1 Peptidase C48, SUMO/Sentrin/Ubl1 [Pseudomonas savastanoi pv. nerii]KWS39048.1 peptidase [Pseudomonas savastanoi pv. nerii]RML68122.1 hypothetical protein ALQ90_200355 [Pseudomonas savastanoi pv. savastanoi]TSC32507.1 peptidase [Pseudomonas sp. ST1]
MWNFNNWSNNLDAYRRLQEAQIGTEELPPLDSTLTVHAEGIESQDRQKSHRHLIQQEEYRGRHLVEQAEIQAYAQHVHSKTPEIIAGMHSVPEHLENISFRNGGRKNPYPEDEELIARFHISADAGESNENTVLIYKKTLTKFSTWLRMAGKPGLHARLFDDGLAEDLKEFVARTQKWHFPLTVLNYLRESVTNKSGAVTIQGFDRESIQITNEDEWLISEAFPEDDVTSKGYLDHLKRFSTWLGERGEQGLCEEDSLHSGHLTALARMYTKEATGRDKLVPALKHLRHFDLTGVKVYAVKRNTRVLPEADRLLSERFAVWLRTQGYGGKVNRRGKEDGASVQASSLRSFSAWLQQERHAPISLASRLQNRDEGLDIELDLYTHAKSASFARTMRTTLRRARQMVADSQTDSIHHVSGFTGFSQLSLHPSWLESQGGAEPSASGGSVNQYPDSPAKSSYSSMFPPTPLSGWPLVPQDSWSAQLEHSSVTLPNSDWSGWGWDPDTPQAITGPLQQPDTEMSDSIFGDLSSINSLSYQDVTGPSQQHEVLDVDSSSSRATIDIIQRLANDPWLWDSDIVRYTRYVEAELQGHPRAALLNFVDPQQVRLLVEGDQRLRNEVLPHLTGRNTPPILLMPVNNNNQHWSLLCVNRQTGQAFHYDSMVSPETAHLATNTSQYFLARRIAMSMGVANAPMGMPIARQRDTYSCADHVLTGIEALARRTVSGQIFQPEGMDLKGVRPNRDHVVEILKRTE